VRISGHAGMKAKYLACLGNAQDESFSVAGSGGELNAPGANNVNATRGLSFHKEHGTLWIAAGVLNLFQILQGILRKIAKEAIFSGLGQCQTASEDRGLMSPKPSVMIESGLPKFQMQSSGLSTSTSAINPPDREIPSTFKGWLNRGVQDQKQILVAPFHKKNL